MTIQAKSLADVLPVQEHYYLLHDGKKFAMHGTPEATGLLVFETREQTDHFYEAVGKAVPTFQPVRVSAEELLRLVEEVGAVCVVDGLKVVVATLKPQRAKPIGTGASINPEGVVPEDSNWEPA